MQFFSEPLGNKDFHQGLVRNIPSVREALQLGKRDGRQTQRDGSLCRFEVGENDSSSRFPVDVLARISARPERSLLIFRLEFGDRTLLHGRYLLASFLVMSRTEMTRTRRLRIVNETTTSRPASVRP